MAYSRKTWGARGSVPVDTSPKRELFLHHTASTYGGPTSWDTLSEQRAVMRAIELQHISQGWSTIGYSYVVFQPAGRFKFPRVYEGRGWKGLPAAQLNHNSGTVAVCVVSNNNVVRRTTKLRLLAIARRARKKGVVRIGGHRDVTPTACPGYYLYALLPWLRKHSGLGKV